MAGNILATMLLMIQAKSDTSGLNRTDRAIRRTTGNIRNARREMRLLSAVSRDVSRLLLGGVGLFAIRNVLGGYLDFEKRLGAIHSRFFAITKDSKQASEEFEFARKIAKDTATDINSVIDSYSIFYSSAKRSLGKENAREVYRSWTEVSRVLHLSGTQYERVMYALREMSSKGQLYAQDLMIQMGTHVPDVRNIAETAIKNLDLKGIKSIKDFQDYTKKNTGSDAMARFLVEFSREARKRYATDDALKKALEQPDALAQRIAQFGFDFMYQFSKSGGSYMVVKVLDGILRLLNGIDFYAVTATLGNIAKFVGKSFQYLQQIYIILRAILIQMMILSVARGLSGMFKKSEFATWLAWALANGQGKLIPKVIFTSIFTSIKTWFTKVFGAILFKQGVKLGVKSLAGLALNAIPVVGQILSVIMWIWTAVDLIKSLMPSKDKDKDKNSLVSTNTVNIMKAMAEKIKQNPNLANDPELLNKTLRYYKGGEALINHTWVDNGKIEINIDGNLLDANQLADKVAKELKNAQKEKKNKFFNKPAETGPKQGVYWG